MSLYVKRFALCLVAMMTVFPFFTNCSAPLHAVGYDELASSSSASGGDVLSPVDSSTGTGAINEKALLSSEQVLKSMSSVTGVMIDSTIANEYKQQQNVLADNYNITSITAPMMIGVTNLAGRFCSQLVSNEAGQTDMTKRTFFKFDFNTKPASLQAADYTAAIQAMAQAFWGRQATTAELDSFNQALTDFLAGVDSTIPNSSTSRGLMVMDCTAMLSSFDAVTL